MIEIIEWHFNSNHTEEEISTPGFSDRNHRVALQLTPVMLILIAALCFSDRNYSVDLLDKIYVSVFGDFGSVRNHLL